MIIARLKTNHADNLSHTKVIIKETADQPLSIFLLGIPIKPTVIDAPGCPLLKTMRTKCVI